MPSRDRRRHDGLASAFAALIVVAVLPLSAAAEDSDSQPIHSVVQAEPDPVMEALELELERAWSVLTELEEPPYYIGLQVIALRSVEVHGEEGGLQGYAPRHGRVIHADVRIGGPELDSTHPLRDAGWEDPSSSGRELGGGDDADVLRREIWREIDEQYRGALDRWQRVLADQQVLVAEASSFDLAPAPPEQEIHPIATLGGVDFDAWEQAAVQASAVFGETGITQDPYVSISGEAETRWFVSSVGHRLREGRNRFRAAIQADTLADDGTVLALYRSWDTATADQLPDGAFLQEQASDVTAQLVSLRGADEQEPYRGPAILSGRASAVFFHEIFGHRVEGHRLKRVDDAQTFRNRVGQGILPSFLSVYDDPTLPRLADEDLRGFYRFDDEGVRTERVTLVKDGVLEGFLESRSPVEAGRSNAHGRRQAGNDVVTRQGNLIVEAAETVSDDELRARLIAAAREEGLEYALSVDDIDGGFTFTDRDIPNAFQIDVVLARRIYVDGRPDELVRGIDLIGTPLQTFSKIAAAGPTPEVFNGTCGAESGWVPVSAASPALLVGQIETQRKGKAQSKPPLIGAPVAADLPESSADGDVLLEALLAETERARDGLLLPDAEPPAWVVAAVYDRDQAYVTADFGVLRRESGAEGRPGRVEVVVGTPELNSSRIEGGAVASLPDAIKQPRLVMGDAAVGIARDIWITADESYKAALQRLTLKAASRRALSGEAPPPDWIVTEPVVALDAGPVREVDRERLRTIAVEASARLRPLGGTLRVGQVLASENQGRTYLVDTEGTRIVQPAGFAAVYAYADLVREDGVRLFDRRQWVARSASDLPSVEEIADEVESMGLALLFRAEADAVGYYEGPVVFEGEAAVDLFRYLLPPEVRGTPPAPEAGRSYQQQVRGGPRLGRRVLPTGWVVSDDPSAAPPGLAGGYTYDFEGVEGQPVQLVDDGYVRDFVMTRVPRRDRSGSNGHARGDVQGELSSRLSVWSVRPKRLLKDRRFAGEVAQLRRAAGQPAVLVVRRMEQGWEGDLPMPTDAVWRFADGTEIPVLHLEFQGVDRRTLRGIAAAGGPLQTRGYLGPSSVFGRAGTISGLPMVLTCPSQVVIGELEAVFPGTGEERARYSMPPLQ